MEKKGIFHYCDKLKSYGTYFLWCVLLGVSIYCSKIVNELPNPDTIGTGMAYKDAWQWEASLGRYLIKTLQELRVNVINTEFVTVMCLLMLALICTILCELFKIEGFFSRFIVALLVYLSPSVGGTLTYYYCSDMYIFSMLLSVIGVVVAIKNRDIRGKVICAICICCSLAIYQANISVAIVLCLVYVVYELLNEENEIKKIIANISHMAIAGASGVGLYVISNAVFLTYHGIEATEARGFSKMGKVAIEDIPFLIKSAYKGFIEYYLSTTMINNSWGWRREINIIFFVIAGLGIIIVLCLKKWSLSRKLLALLCVAVYPLAAMCIVIIAPEASIYGSTGPLMLPAMNYTYLVVCILFDKITEFKDMQVGRIVVSACKVSVLMVGWMLLILELSGQTYMKYYMNKTHSVARAMVEEISEVAGECGTNKVCIVGTMERGNYPEQYSEILDGIQWTTASKGLFWKGYFFNQVGWFSFMRHYLGNSYENCSEEEYQALINTEIFANMEKFPYENSVRIIDDVVVVKLSDSY